MKQRVIVLLPVHNRKAVTEKFIRLLLAQQHQLYKLVLIDDGSTDGTAAMVRSVLPNAVVITGKGNWWWGGSLHQGYKWIKSNVHTPDDVVLIANDDIEFAADYLCNALRFLQIHPNALLQSQAYSKHTGQLKDKGTFVNWKKLAFERAANQQQINCLSTRGLFMKISTFLKVGGFHPVLLPHYISDYEFTIRAGRKGFMLATDECVRIVMDEQTTGIRTLQGVSAWNYLKRSFSKKAAVNPLFLTSFILLACPVRFVPINVLRVWRGFIHEMLESLKQKKAVY